MKFILAIEPGDEQHAFSVVVPDLPGCFSAGDSLDEAYAMAAQAIDHHCRILIEDGQPIPPTSTLAEHQADPEFAGWIWGLIDVPIERYLGPAEKLNITLPKLLLAQIDSYTACHPGMTRSGFLASAAIQAMRS